MIDHITASKVPKYKCPEGKKSITIYMDDRSGLSLTVTANGSRSWCHQYKCPVTKTTARDPIGSAKFVTVDEAKAIVFENRKMISKGIDPRDKKRSAKAVLKYSDFMEGDAGNNGYLKFAEPRKSYAATERRIYNNRLKGEFGGLRINQISRKHIQDYQTKLLDSGLAPATCNRVIQLLRHSLNMAVDWDLLDKNPAKRIKLFREENQIERFLSDEQLINLMSILKSDHNRPVSRIILWLLSTGARLNEALHSTWDNIDKDNRVWKIPLGDTKARKSRNVALSGAAMTVLDDIGDCEEGWLFPNPQTGKPYVTITRVWHRIRKEAGISEFRLHDLRHSFASYLAQSGMSTIVIAEALGHSDYRISQRYVHLSNENSRIAANAAGDKIMAAMDKAAGQN